MNTNFNILIEVQNIKTALKKVIKVENFSVVEVSSIFAFYKSHANYNVLVDGEIQ